LRRINIKRIIKALPPSPSPRERGVLDTIENKHFSYLSKNGKGVQREIMVSSTKWIDWY